MSSVHKLPLVLESQPEGGYTVTCPLLPELITEGDSIQQAVQNASDALAAIIEAFEDLGRPLLPDWGAKDLKSGTVRAVVRQLGLDWAAFIRA